MRLNRYALGVSRADKVPHIEGVHFDLPSENRSTVEEVPEHVTDAAKETK